jgi:hypothetical protein
MVKPNDRHRPANHLATHRSLALMKSRQFITKAAFAFVLMTISHRQPFDRSPSCGTIKNGAKHCCDARTWICTSPSKFNYPPLSTHNEADAVNVRPLKLYGKY